MTSVMRFAAPDRWDAGFGDSLLGRDWRWPMAVLKDVADIRLGTQLQSKISDGIKLPYLRAANVQRGFLDLTDVTPQRCGTLGQRKGHPVSWADRLLADQWLV